MLVPKYKDMDGEVIEVVLQQESFFSKIWKRFFFKKKMEEEEEEEESVNLNLNANLDVVPTAMNLNYIYCTFVQ